MNRAGHQNCRTLLHLRDQETANRVLCLVDHLLAKQNKNNINYPGTYRNGHQQKAKSKKRGELKVFSFLRADQLYILVLVCARTFF